MMIDACRRQRRGKHVTSNSLIDVDGDSATASTDYLFVRPTAEGPAIVAAGRYRDLLVRDGDAVAVQGAGDHHARRGREASRVADAGSGPTGAATGRPMAGAGVPYAMDRPRLRARPSATTTGLRRTRAGAAVAPGLADGVPARGDPVARRLRRVHHLRSVDPVGAGRRGVGQGATSTPAATGPPSWPRAPEPSPTDGSSAPSTAGGGTSTGRTPSSTVPHAFDPELLAPEELCLRQARVETWGGCVWINLDPTAPPLLEALDPIPQPARSARRRRHAGRTGGRRPSCRPTGRWPRRRFMEGYHVPQTHPQLTLGHPEQYDPDSLVYSVYRRWALELPAPAQRPGQKGPAGRGGRGRRHHRVGPPPEPAASRR